MKREIDYQFVLDAIADAVVPLRFAGKVADCIPALANVSPERFGMALHTVGGKRYQVGDASERFSIQRIPNCSRWCMHAHWSTRCFGSVPAEPRMARTTVLAWSDCRPKAARAVASWPASPAA